MIKQIYETRPFKNRNAEDFRLNQILGLFVNPRETLVNPFEVENNVVKGSMGSGKTMLLRANHAFHLYSIVPRLLNDLPLVLPVFLRLSDYQHLTKPDQVYREVIIRMIEEIAKVHLHLLDSEEMVRIHRGIQSLPSSIVEAQSISSVLLDLRKLDSDSYRQLLSEKMGAGGAAKPSFIELSATYEREKVVEVTRKPQPGISDVHRAYEQLLSNVDGSILLLIDEAGALDRQFFVGDKQTSYFEILMNQLRTADYITTKVAVYPHSYSDILTEARYGDVIELVEHIQHDVGLQQFRRRAVDLIESYLTTAAHSRVGLSNVLEASPAKEAAGDCLEQLINGSDGNVRRFLQLLDQSMRVAFDDHGGDERVSMDHALEALRVSSSTLENQFTELDREFLRDIAQVCKGRKTFRFKFPYKSPVLSKYILKSDEQNLVKIVEVGTGRRGTTYAFDYSYCVAHDIPTHYAHNSEAIDKDRSRETGGWIPRVASVSEELVAHAKLPDKIEGVIDFVPPGARGAIINGDDGEHYFLSESYIIEPDRGKKIIAGTHVRFYPATVEESKIAMAIEILT